jgi:hypothetical protein
MEGEKKSVGKKPKTRSTRRHLGRPCGAACSLIDLTIGSSRRGGRPARVRAKRYAKIYAVTGSNR